MKSLKSHRMKLFFICAVLLGCIVFPVTSFGMVTIGGNHYVDFYDNMPFIPWTQGCTPTSAAMVLAYWDASDMGTQGAVFGMGRLVDYWMDMYRYADGTHTQDPKGNWRDEIHNAPNVLLELRINMGTTLDKGSTENDNIGPGILSTTNDWNGYNFQSSQHECKEDNIGDCLNTVKDNINAGYPVLYSGGTDTQGHTVAVVGYDDYGMILCHDPNWDYEKEYSPYLWFLDGTTTLKTAHVDRVWPGGWEPTVPWVYLTSPDGGGPWYVGNTYDITWWENDPTITLSVVSLSTDGGTTWSEIHREQSGSGWHTYSWPIPATMNSTEKARIKVEDWWGSEGNYFYAAGDGSEQKFAIHRVPDLIVQSITTDPTNPQVGQNVSVTLTVKNQSPEDAAYTNLYVDFYKDRAPAGVGDVGDARCWIGDLAADNTKTCTVNVIYDFFGSYQMWAQVDAQGLVIESDKTNNVFGPQTIDISALPDLIVTRIGLYVNGIVTDPADVKLFQGQDVIVVAEVVNQGLGPVPVNSPIDVEVYKDLAGAPLPIQSGDQNCTSTAGLAWEAAYYCVVTFNYGAPGTYNLWAQVNGFLNGVRQVRESDENNNVSGPKSLTILAPLSVEPSNGLTSSGIVGGPFTPSGQEYTLKNIGASSLNWTASSPSVWVTVSPASGTVAPGDSTGVVVSFTSSANYLPPGGYNGDVTFTYTMPQWNQNGSTSRHVGLTVSPPAAATTTSINAPTVTYNADGAVTVTVSSATGTPTGNVSLSVDGSAAITQALSLSGSTTFTITTPNAGDHTLCASYAAQGNFAASADTGTLHVNAAATTTSINAPTVTYNADGAVTVTVSSATGKPRGNVSLSVDGSAAITQALSLSGSTTFTITTPNAGDHTLSASYAAQGNFAASSDTGTLHVNALPTSTSISAPTINYGANGAVTVTVSSSAGAPTGNVSLSVDGSPAITQALSAGSVTFTIPTPNAGNHTLSVTYAAQGNFAASGPTFGTLHVNGLPTTTSINAPTITYFELGVVTVTVSSSAGTPTGGITLSVDNGTAVARVLEAGSATFKIGWPNAGDHALIATYSDQGNFAGSSATGTLHVIAAPTTTSISAPTINYGANGIVTVTVSSAAGAPTGNVSLSVDGVAQTPQALSSFGSATFTITRPSAGDHTLSATYAAQGNFTASSATGTLHVNGSTTTSISAPTINYGANGAVTVTVSSAAGTPTGNVSLRVDGAPAITQALASGSATFTITTNLSAGDHTLSATYAAQGNFTASSATGTLHVNKAQQTINWPSPAPIVYGTPLGANQLNATVTVPGPSPAGQLTYNPIAGTILNLGSNNLTVTAAGTNNYDPASMTVQISVVYSYSGFLPPVYNPDTVNVVSAGRPIAIKWTITNANGVGIIDPSNFKGITSYGVDCSVWTGDPTVTQTGQATGKSGLQNLGNGNWQFNWATSSSYKGTCRTMVLTLKDGTTHQADFQFK